MSKVIHLIANKTEDGKPINVEHISNTINFSSGYWDLSVEEANSLIGGWLYLHEKKSSFSFYGGRISDFNIVIREGVAHAERIAFIFHPRREAKDQQWRGQNHTRAWTGGLVESSLSHELDR